MRKTLLLLCILFTLNNTMAQNVNMWSSSWTPSFRHLRAVQIIGNDKIVAIGGWESNDSIATIATSTNKALSWILEMDNINAILQDLHFPSDTLGYTVGWAGNIWKTTDAGDNWNQLTIAGNPGTRNFNGCYFFDNQSGIVIGGNQSNDSIQTILKTTDGGTNWNVISDNLGYWLNAVYFTDTQTGFAVGDGGTILKSTDGGNNWTSLTLNGSVASRQFMDVYFMDSNVGVAVGGWPDNDSIQTIIRTTDGGVNWSVVSDNLGSMLHGVQFYSSTEGYAVGDDGLVLFSNDAGATWTEQIIPNGNNYGLKDVFFKNSDFGIACGNEGKIMLYDDTTAVTIAPTGNLFSPVKVTSETSVLIHGELNDNGLSATVEFEYGTSIAFGNTISMSPSSSLGIGIENVSLTLDNLTPNALYYGRMKLSNSLGTGYSNTIAFFTGLSVIPNYNFESWDSVNTQLINVWSSSGNVTQVASNDGSFAVKLNSKGNELGVINYGQPGPSGFIGGTPFTARPDSIVFWCTYDVSLNDSALVVLQLKANGATMSDTIYKIGGTSNGWERHSFEVNYTTTTTPDSMVLAFTNTNVFAGNVDSLSTITVDNVSFIGTNENVPNPNMESWIIDTRHKASSWVSNDDQHAETPYLIEKSTIAHSGNYAIQLKNKVGGNNQQYASIKTGDDPYNWGPSFPVMFKHQNFYGFYQFTPDNGDTLFADISMYENGVQVGYGGFFTDSATSDYELFHIPINYWSNPVPDSCMISFRIYKNNGGAPGNSMALIDDLSFESVISSITENSLESSIISQAILYPNPSSGIVNIKFDSDENGAADFYVIDLSGKQIKEGSSFIFENKMQLDLESLQSQLYFLIIKKEENIYTFKIQLK